MFTERTRERIARNLAFWRRDETDRPLIGAHVGRLTQPAIYRVAAEGDVLTPDVLRPEAFFDCAEEEAAYAESLDLDLFAPVSTIYGVPWLEACLGMPVSVQGESIWAHPLLDEDEPLEALHVERRAEWIELLVRSTEAFVAHFAGRYPVAVPFLRGPADVVTGMLGTARACIELYDHPDAMRALIDRCADAWQDIARRVQGRIPAWQGGWVNNARPLYSPGPAYYSSEDSTAFLSMATFRRFFLPADVRMSGTFPYGFIHRHGVSHQNIAGLLEINPTWAIEITLDPTGPRAEELLPLMGQLQAAGRPLIVFGVGDEAELEVLLRGLSPRGLCIVLQAEDDAAARRLIAAARS